MGETLDYLNSLDSEEPGDVPEEWYNDDDGDEEEAIEDIAAAFHNAFIATSEAFNHTPRDGHGVPFAELPEATQAHLIAVVTKLLDDETIYYV